MATGAVMAGDTARLQLLYQLGCAFAAHIELEDLVSQVVVRMRDLLEAEGASLLLLDDDSGELYFPYVVGRDDQVTAQLHSVRFPATAGLAGEALASRCALRVDDTQKDPRFLSLVDAATGVVTRCLMAAPLVGRRGPIGVLEVVNRRGGGAFSESDLAFLEAISGSIGIALENAQLYAIVKASEETLRAEVGALRRDIARRDRFDEIVSSNVAMAEVFRLMEKASASPISVLIEGETGTGKELVARAIHRASERAARPFIAVNCAALPEGLLESELFGHRRGAFTGAVQDRRGLFEAAHGGTIFLDEVGDMPAVMQAKLLRVLQEGELTPVGESRSRKVDVRVITATNRDLTAAVAARTFRDDLYYRLAQFPIVLPPLRERRDDVPLIADRLLAAASRRNRKSLAGFTSEAIAMLTAYDWPGNVRQLQNEIERAVALAASGERIGIEHLSAVVTGPRTRTGTGADTAAGTPRVAGARSDLGAAGDPAAAASAGDAELQTTGGPQRDPRDAAREAAAAGPTRRSLREERERFEIAFVTEVLSQERGNVTRAAQVLGISRVMLQRKMRDFGLR